MKRLPRPLLVAALLAALAAVLPAQIRPGEKCTVCGHDAEIMAATGVSHGPFIFARSDSETIEQEYFWRPVWVETPHFRMGLMIEKWKVPEEERKDYRAELEQLQEIYPRIKPKSRILDPWLRAHLIAWRLENFYAMWAKLMGAREGQFDDPEALRMLGMGPYLGESDKYEVMVFRNRAPYREFMSRTWGLTYVKPQRWNNIDRDCLWFGMNMEEEGVRHDKHLFAMILHNIGLNMLNGYLHYSYEMPIWIKEGAAHWCSRQFDPRFNTFDTVEGSFHEAKSLTRWEPEVRKLVQKDRAASFASLMRRASFAELDFNDHLIVWSKVDFLIRHDPEKFGRFITFLKSRRDERGLPDGSNMDDAQRQAFREIYGWTIQKAEEAWREFVLSEYPVK